MPKRLFVACGSVNVISKEQLDFAQEHGFYRMTINPGKHLREGYLESSAGKKWINRLKYYYTRERSCILDTTTENIKKMTEGEKQGLKLARVEVGNLMGKIMKNLLDCNVDNTVLIVGGDTLLEFFECMHCDEIIPISEIKPGLVLSELYIENKKRWVISKSGGFGNKELLVELWDEICSERI
ncbi:MAG: nucleotide-binding domain containing protein [Lachnospiraceae bacterium]